MADLTEHITHLAFSILHGTFDQNMPGGCSCATCAAILSKMDELRKEEAAAYYSEHYPPPGGLL